jgi:hypothetical protein
VLIKLAIGSKLCIWLEGASASDYSFFQTCFGITRREKSALIDSSVIIIFSDHKMMTED